MRIGKCSVKTQGKIIVQLNGINLPKIGSRAFVSRNSKQKPIGEVIEAIGSTQNPWVVISAKKSMFQEVQINEEIFTHELPKTNKDQRFRRKHKNNKKRKI